jgi:hypothetical protein
MNAAPSRSFPYPGYSSPSEDGTEGLPKSRSKVSVQSFGIPEPSAREMAGGPAHERARVLSALRDEARARTGGRAGGMLPLAAEEFRDWFCPAFARWLQLNFENPVHVGRAFGVRHSTAQNWWNGSNRATGDMVAIVFLTFPHAVAWFMAEWEGR